MTVHIQWTLRLGAYHAPSRSVHCVDVAYLVEHPETVDRLIEHQRIRVTPLSSGAISTTMLLTLDDGTDLFAKMASEISPPTGSDFFTVEAECLRWLGHANAVPVPKVIAATAQTLVLEWVKPNSPSKSAAVELGRDLAALHHAGADSFGAPWQGYIGSLPLDNRPMPSSGDWHEFYIERRCRPYLRQAVDKGTIDAAELRTVENAFARIPQRAGPSEPPARLHGDLWSGNVHYGADGQAWLVDPAAHGGHRETDLASLALFGAPYLDAILASYQEVTPLAEDWRDRIPLHQLHMLLTHCVLFGRSYVPQLLSTARTV